MNLASAQRIMDIVPIEGADQIELAKVLGWQVVTKKGEYKINDLCSYIQIDTVVPDKPEFDFLRTRDFRVRTIKLRGQLSQGLIVPLPKGKWSEGEDLTDILQITKFSKEKDIAEPKQKAPKGFYKKYIWLLKQLLYSISPFLRPTPDKIPFPTHLVSKTNEERIQNIPSVLEKYRGKKFVITEKLDGSSITIIYNEKKHRICSRNWEMVKGDDEWTRVAKEAGFHHYLHLLSFYFNTNKIIVQGEYIGKPQKNPYKLDKNEIRLFNIIVDGKRISPLDFAAATQELNIPTCPILNIVDLNFTMDQILKYAEDKSTLNRNTEREGLVFRDIDNTISFKVISNKFLLKNNE